MQPTTYNRRNWNQSNICRWIELECNIFQLGGGVGWRGRGGRGRLGQMSIARSGGTGLNLSPWARQLVLILKSLSSWMKTSCGPLRPPFKATVTSISSCIRHWIAHPHPHPASWTRAPSRNGSMGHCAAKFLMHPTDVFEECPPPPPPPLPPCLTFLISLAPRPHNPFCQAAECVADWC